MDGDPAPTLLEAVWAPFQLPAVSESPVSSMSTHSRLTQGQEFVVCGQLGNWGPLWIWGLFMCSHRIKAPFAPVASDWLASWKKLGFARCQSGSEIQSHNKVSPFSLPPSTPQRRLCMNEAPSQCCLTSHVTWSAADWLEIISCGLAGWRLRARTTVWAPPGKVC